MYSFYGGRPGNPFVIVATFASYSDMVDAFKQGAEFTDVHFDEYVMINTVNKNDADNGKIYRRGYNFNDTDTGGAEYIGTIVGPAGASPIMAISTMEDLKKIKEEEEQENVEEAIYDENNNYIVGKRGTFSSENESLVPGSKANNDKISWRTISIRNASGGDTTVYVGFKIPYNEFNFTASIIDDPYAQPTITKDELSSRPFYDQWTIGIPAGKKGNSTENLRVITITEQNQDSINYPDDKEAEKTTDAENNRPILVYDEFFYDEETASFETYYVGKVKQVKNIITDASRKELVFEWSDGSDNTTVNLPYKEIENITLDPNGTLTFIYDDKTEITPTQKLKWIDSISKSTDGKLQIKWNDNTSEDIDISFTLSEVIIGETNAEHNVLDKNGQRYYYKDIMYANIGYGDNRTTPVSNLEAGDDSDPLYFSFGDISRSEDPFDSTRSYSIGDVASYNGTYYVCKQNSTGDFSTANWEQAKPGHLSFTQGDRNIAIGKFSHSEGLSTIALGQRSHTEGNNTITDADYAHAEGQYTEANGIASHAEGGNDYPNEKTRAEGKYSHAEGQSAVATGEAAHAEGYKTEAIGNESHAEGYGALTNNAAAHAEGKYTEANGIGSHAEGGSGDQETKTIANGNYSHAEGRNTLSNAEAAHSEGFGTIASKRASHAEGQYTEASGIASHAEGGSSSSLEKTTASGNYSHAEGKNTKAIGDSSHAGGAYSEARGDQSFAIGLSTIASANTTAQTVIGKYNTEDPTEAFIIGNGTDTNTRSNAFSIDWNGDVTITKDANINGNLHVSGDTATFDNALIQKNALYADSNKPMFKTITHNWIEIGINPGGGFGANRDIHQDGYKAIAFLGLNISGEGHYGYCVPMRYFINRDSVTGKDQFSYYLWNQGDQQAVCTLQFTILYISESALVNGSIL